MTKQEEIREGIKALKFNIASYGGMGSYTSLQDEDINLLYNYLHSQGVVIKVDIYYGDMEKVQFGLHGDNDKKLIHSVTVNDIRCVAVEPLVEE